MTGACLGFLWFNCNPAAVFMGDTGSLAMGGLIGYIAIVIRHEMVLLLVGGVFVIEAVSVMLQVGYFKYTRIILWPSSSVQNRSAMDHLVFRPFTLICNIHNILAIFLKYRSLIPFERFWRPLLKYQSLIPFITLGDLC